MLKIRPDEEWNPEGPTTEHELRGQKPEIDNARISNLNHNK